MNYNSPKEIALKVAKSGIEKAEMPIMKFALLAILGGAFIAFGGLLTVIVAGGMPEVSATNPGLVKFVAGALFPIGLIMVSVAGADLFTSDCTAMTLPFMQKKKGIFVFIKVLTLSYLFNFIGAQFIAYFMTAETGIIAQGPYSEYLHNLASAKVDQNFYKVFIKGIGANWLVCLGAWMGYAGRTITCKALGTWIPVMLFVTLGYEHSIANMFFIPAAIYTGADISWLDFIYQNLIPATIGNLVGGIFFVGVAYWYIYLKDEDEKEN